MAILLTAAPALSVLLYAATLAQAECSETNNTASIAYTNSSTGFASGTTSTPSASHGLNGTTPSNGTAINGTLTGDCWDQWTEYWDQSSTPGPSYAPTTFTKISTSYGVEESSSYYSYVETNTLTVDVFSGLDIVSTELDAVTYTETGYSTEYSTTFTTIKTTTITSSTRVPTHSTTPRAKLPTPTCSLPSLVPQCQSEWSSFISSVRSFDSGNPAGQNSPSCEQASLASTDCDLYRSHYIDAYSVNGNDGNAGYQTVDGSTTWPTTMSFAPSCTLGCWKCAITGDSAQLLYWPTSTQVSAGAQASANATAIPEVGTYVTQSTTLTSPTIYISYDTLYARNSCGAVGQTYYNQIIPVTDNSQLSSLVKPSDYGYVTEPFNTNNLYTPASALPASVYDQQPQCWTYTGTAPLCIPEVQEPGCVSSYTCSQTAPYEPLIAVPVEITALDPSWANCTAWYGGLSASLSAIQPPTAVATSTSANVATPSTLAKTGATISGVAQATAA